MHAPSLAQRSITSYAAVTEDDLIQRLQLLSERLDESRILHINSTASGGGVAELLSSIVPLCRDLGIDDNWLVMDATDEFFDVTKSMHNGLQGDGPPLTDEMIETYLAVNEENAVAIDSDFDLIVLHDPQPLGMLPILRDSMPQVPIIWRCHIDLTDPLPAYLSFVTGYAERVDLAIFSRSRFGESVDITPMDVIHPSIDPVSEKNRDLDSDTVATEIDHLDPLSFDSPIITQVSRFDPWKDQFGTLDIYRRASELIPDLQLALVGGMAADDPEGMELYERVAKEGAADPDVHVLTDLPDQTVNVLQRESDVVVQKSLREGFGLVVSEALWKRTPVVGSSVGGIPLQIINEHNGYLVEPDDVPGAAERVVRLLENDAIRETFSKNAREHVRQEFLLPRQVADLLKVFSDVLAPEDR